MDLPPPLPPEITRKLLDASFPPPAPLLPRALAFIADGLLAGLLACLVVHQLIPVFIPDDFPVFEETLQSLWQDYIAANQATASGNPAAANAFLQSIPEKVGNPAVQTATSFISLTAMLSALAYFTLSESLTRGASFGKKIFRLRVISTLTGDSPRFLQTLSRSLWRACSVAPAGLLIGIAVTINAHVPFFSYRRRAWHDKLAHTEVVDAKDA